MNSKRSAEGSAQGATPDVAVIVPAAGRGRRLGAERNKVLLPLFGGQCVLAHTLAVFQRHPAIGRIVVVVGPDDAAALETLIPPGAARTRMVPWVLGGAERQASVFNGLLALADSPPAHVLVHDGARPFCDAALIDRVLAALATNPGQPPVQGVVPVLPLADTVRRRQGDSSQVVPREGLFAVQTPQGFDYAALLRAHEQARDAGFLGTDDAQLLENAGMPLAFAEGDAWNFKITTARDLELARRLQGS